MQELIHEAPAPFPQLEEQVSAWQLSPLLDRNPKLHCSSTSHLVPACAELTCRQAQGILEEDISNTFHFPAYQSQAAQALFTRAQASRADDCKVQQGMNNSDAATKGKSLDLNK